MEVQMIVDNSQSPNSVPWPPLILTMAVAASLGLGMFTAFFGAFVAPAYTTAAAFGVLLLLLVVRPAGLATK